MPTASLAWQNQKTGPATPPGKRSSKSGFGSTRRTSAQRGTSETVACSMGICVDPFHPPLLVFVRHPGLPCVAPLLVLLANSLPAFRLSVLYTSDRARADVSSQRHLLRPLSSAGLHIANTLCGGLPCPQRGVLGAHGALHSINPSKNPSGRSLDSTKFPKRLSKLVSYSNDA